MRRFASACVALLVVSASSRPLCGDEPLEVGVELTKINAQFSEAVGGKAYNAATYRAATTTRNEAIAKLIKQAEEAKSQEHVPLAQAYQTVGRPDDAVREARAAALAEGKKESLTYTILIGALSVGGKMDEAEKALAEAQATLGNKTSLIALHQTLANGYQRAGRYEDAAEHIGEYLHALWPSVVNSPERTSAGFQQQLSQLSSAATRAKSADKILPIIEKLEKRIAAEAADNKKLEPILAALQTAKVRTLVAGGKLDAAAKVADEQLAAAEKKLAAEPKDSAALSAILAAKQLKVQAAGEGEQAGKLAEDLNQFIDKHLEAMADSSEFITAASNSLATRAYGLMSAGKYDEAEKALNAWKTRLDGLKAESPAAKLAVANAGRSVTSLLGRLEGEMKRAALVGQPYFPIEEATWLNGSPLKPEELRGKAVLLDFWAVWCGPCIATFPHLKHWNEEYGDKGLVIIGVTNRYQFDWDAEAKRPKNVDDLAPEKEDAATTQFVAHHGLKHRIAVMSDRSISGKYLVSGIPQAVLIDRQGLIRLIRVGSGEANAQAMEAAIRQALDLPVAKASE